MTIISLTNAVVCWNCRTVSDAKGERCPSCDSKGGIQNLSVALQSGYDMAATMVTSLPTVEMIRELLHVDGI